MDIIDYYEVYNTDTGALASQTTILDDPNVPEEKRLQPDSTDYNMFATEKNIFITLYDTAYMVDIPTTWAPTTQCRAHTFPHKIDQSVYPSTVSFTGIVFLAIQPAEDDLGDTKEVVWYWGLEDKDPIKMFEGKEGRLRPILSQSGKYLVIADFECFRMFDSTDKHNIKLIWQMNEHMLYYTPYFSNDETRLMFCSSSGEVEWMSTTSDKFERTQEDDSKVLVEIDHSNKSLNFMEISPGRFFHASHDACWITDTRMPPLKSAMEIPKYARDGKSMVYHDVLKNRNSHVVTDLSGKESKEIYAMQSVSTISLSPSFRFEATGYTWETPPKFALRTVVSSDFIFHFMNCHFVCFSPDEQMLCYCSSPPNNYRLTIVPIGKSMQKKVKALSFEVPHGFDVDHISQCTTFSYSNQYLIIHPCRGNFQLVNLKTGKISFLHSYDEKAVAFSHDEKYLAIACSSQVILYNLQEEKIEFGMKLRDDEQSIECVAFSHNSEAVLFGFGSEVRWCSVKDGTLLYRFDLVSLSTSISTTQFSEKVLLGDKADALMPMDNRKFEQNGYGVPALQPLYQIADVVIEDIEDKIGRRTQAGTMLVRRIRDWLVEAKTQEKDPRKIEERFKMHLATHAPPQVIDVTNTPYEADYTVAEPESGPAFPFWANKTHTKSDTGLAFDAIAKAVTSAVPTPFFSEKGKNMLAEFAKQLLEIFEEHPKSVEYASLAQLIERSNPIEKIEAEMNETKKKLQEEREKAKEDKEAEAEKEKEATAAEADKKPDSEVEAEKEEEQEEEPEIVVEKTEEQINRIKAFGDQLRALYAEHTQELLNSNHYDAKFVEDKEKESAENDEKVLAELARSLQNLFIALAEAADPTDDVLRVAKELAEKLPGYLYEEELEVKVEEDYLSRFNFDEEINAEGDGDAPDVDLDALLASLNFEDDSTSQDVNQTLDNANDDNDDNDNNANNANNDMETKEDI